MRVLGEDEAEAWGRMLTWDKESTGNVLQTSFPIDRVSSDRL